MNLFRALPAAALAALLAFPAAAVEFHNSVVLYDAFVLKTFSDDAPKVNHVEKGMIVKVGQCDRVGRYCFVDIPGTNGWLRADALAQRRPPKFNLN